MSVIISVEHLAYSYPGPEGSDGVRVFEDLNLTVEEGSFVAILGSNGCGKSTLAKHFNSILLPCGGKVYVCGMDTSREICTLAGWAFDPDGDCLKGDKHIALVCGEDIVWCETASVLRPDVTAAYADSLGGKNVDYAGFSASFRKSDLHPGKWQVIVVIDDGAGNAAYTELDKRVRID